MLKFGRRDVQCGPKYLLISFGNISHRIQPSFSSRIERWILKILWCKKHQSTCFFSTTKPVDYRTCKTKRFFSKNFSTFRSLLCAENIWSGIVIHLCLTAHKDRCKSIRFVENSVSWGKSHPMEKEFKLHFFLCIRTIITRKSGPDSWWKRIHLWFSEVKKRNIEIIPRVEKNKNKKDCVVQ